MTKSEYNRIDHLHDTITEAFEAIDCGRISLANQFITSAKMQSLLLKRLGEKKYGDKNE